MVWNVQDMLINYPCVVCSYAGFPDWKYGNCLIQNITVYKLKLTFKNEMLLPNVDNTSSYTEEPLLFVDINITKRSFEVG